MESHTKNTAFEKAKQTSKWDDENSGPCLKSGCKIMVIFLTCIPYAFPFLDGSLPLVICLPSAHQKGSEAAGLLKNPLGCLKGPLGKWPETLGVALTFTGSPLAGDVFSAGPASPSKGASPRRAPHPQSCFQSVGQASTGQLKEGSVRSVVILSRT